MRYFINKALHKYYKREGVKGKYIYYYTKDEYDKSHKQAETPINHKNRIIEEFKNQFLNKNIPLEQIETAIILMDIRANSWAKETGNDVNEWDKQIDWLFMQCKNQTSQQLCMK